MFAVLHFLEDFALEAKMWWRLWWLRSSVRILLPPAWEQQPKGFQRKHELWLLWLALYNSALMVSHCYLWDRPLSNSVLCGFLWPQERKHNSPLYSTSWRGKGSPYTSIKIVVTGEGDGGRSWGALPLMIPPSHQCSCQPWQIFHFILP